MTFFERYHSEGTWYGKVLIMEIFHLLLTQHDKKWTIKQTAESFKVSIGLVSENLQIASYSHFNPAILNCDTRQSALNKLERTK